MAVYHSTSSLPQATADAAPRFITVVAALLPPPVRAAESAAFGGR
jgi:hypothetical protein